MFLRHLLLQRTLNLKWIKSLINMLLNSNLSSLATYNLYRLPSPKNLDFAQELSMFTMNNLKYIVNIPEQDTQNNKKSKEEKTILDENSQELDQTVKTLLTTQSLYTNPEFKLVLNANVENPLCKGKYFSFKILLKANSNITFPIHEVIELEVLVFSNDNLLITKNMKGSEILRGNAIQNMHYFKLESIHVAYFRVQLTEVSSHFVGKTVTLKIKARKSELLKATGWKIQSIVIPNLLVKAKNRNYKRKPAV